MSPWYFDKAFLILGNGQSWRGGSLSVYTFLGSNTFFAVFAITQNIGRFIGGLLGKVTEVEADAHGNYHGRFIRVRGLLDVLQPLKRDAKVRLGSSSEAR